MDSSEASKLIIQRICQLEPEHIARKIIGFIYFQGISDQEMIRLALGPETLIHNLIHKAKTARLLDPASNPLHLTPFPAPNPAFKMVPFSDLEDPLNNPSLMEYPSKTCHYFNKGFCKHGTNCRYFHQESFPKTFAASELPSSGDVSPGSLDKIESEITEILRSRRGQPVSIASLPMMYYEKYGTTLQADGYLTESQRHGKAGYSLTKLLARLKNSIRLIDRPHGQHAVVLAEDAPKYYMDIQGDRNDPGPIVNGSRQIYLTFPPESTFTEEDVSAYFSTFGPVQDVRIPCQQKRMFGFVSFESSDTVQLVLSKMNPHYVCGSRVLVKPYREKPKLIERKYHPMYYHANPVDINSELQTRWESSRMFRRQLMEEQHKRYTMELQAMQLSQLHLGCRPVPNSNSMDELKFPEDHLKFPAAERLSLMLDALNSDDNPELLSNTCSDQESAQILNLPDSPFAPAVM